MSGESLVKFWTLIQSLIGEFLEITEPHVEEAAIRCKVPIELYYYSEMGLESFSIQAFQKRDPFSNPQLFEKIFVTLNVKGWILPQADGSYLITEKARQQVRRITQVGDGHLPDLETVTNLDLPRLVHLLKQIILANEEAPEPPEKWAITNRFHAAEMDSPRIVQIRELLMDLLAYRDDCHLAAARPHFGRAGIVWSVLGTLWRERSVTAEQMAETHSFRGYEADDYGVALQAVAQIGWAEEAETADAFRITAQGRRILEDAERLTDEYFYKPWSVLSLAELNELYGLLRKLREQLAAFRGPAPQTSGQVP